MNRPRRLSALLACLAMLAPARAAELPAPSRADEIQLIAPGVSLLPGRFDRGRQPDGNSLILQGSEGLVVIDTGRHVEHTSALLGAARRRGRPLLAVLNTHWHLDHLGGNILLRKEVPNLQVWASAAVPEALAGIMARNADDLKRMLADPSLDEATRRMVQIDAALLAQRAAMAPDHTLEGAPQALTLAGRRLQVGVERNAVSGGDIWVLDLESRVLAVGDLVTLPVPFFDTACAPAWQAALGRIEALPFERLVPGHGPVMSRDDFGRYRRAFDDLLACAASPSPEADCAAGWASGLGPLLAADAQARAASMLGYYLGQLRAPPAQRDRFCAAR